MTKGGILLGDWTHRRGDPGGSRYVAADVAHAKPEVAWAWKPPHGGRVDQVRIAGRTVFVAAMAAPLADAPGWEHATIYALDADTGRVVASRALPDPAPVAAMLVEAGLVHVVATRRGEPILRYALDVSDLAPKLRRTIDLDRDGRREDVLDAWSSPDGGLWLELEGAQGATGGRAYAFVGAQDGAAVTQTHLEDVAAADWGAPARDACCAGQVLFVPVASTRPILWRVEQKAAAPLAMAGLAPLVAPSSEAWARTDVDGPRARLHALVSEGLVHAVAIAVDAERDDRAVMELLAVDSTSGTMRWRSPLHRTPLRATLGDGARLARRGNGEVLVQALDAEGAPATDLVCMREGDDLGSVALGNGKRFVLDAALGELALAHHEAKSGKVTVGAFEIDREGRLLGGRRSVMRWSFDVDDLGGATTVYAGAGHIVVRGARGIAALAV